MFPSRTVWALASSHALNDVLFNVNLGLLSLCDEFVDFLSIRQLFILSELETRMCEGL